MSTLPPLRTGHKAGADLIERRASAATFTKNQVLAAGVEIAEVALGNVPCVVCTPSAPRATILYLHGGGFRLGRARGWTGFASRVAGAAEARIVIADYRLAPEHPFPAALHDAASVYDALTEPEAIFVAGDSAGGGLAASLAVATGDRVRRPRGLILLSPWLDLTLHASTWESRAATDRLFGRDAAMAAAEGYLQGHPADDPLASPIFADLSVMPPVLLFAGGAESLLGDGIAFAEGLALAGGTIEAHLVAGMQHVWPTLFPDLPESQAALAAMAAFVRRF